MIRILYAGIHDVFEIYRELLIKDFPDRQITLDLANSDNLLWCVEDVEKAYEKTPYDLCILLAGNLLSVKKDDVPLINYSARMNAVCKLIKDLVSKGSKIVIVFSSSKEVEDMPGNFITSGASVVYCDPMNSERLMANLPVLLG